MGPPYVRMGRRVSIPMIFQSFNKGLRLVLEAGRKEVDKSTGTPVLIQHPQREIHFKNWRYETDKEDEIAFLKRHDRFSEVTGLPDTFWVFIPPRDYAAELALKDAQIEHLKQELESKGSKTEKPPFCTACDTKGYTHKRDCPTLVKTDKPVSQPQLVS